MSHSLTTLSDDHKNFEKDMRKLLNHKESSDLKFVLGATREVIFAHQCILMARCEVFRAMLAEQSNIKTKDGKISLVMSDSIPEVFSAMLQYIYTNCVTLNSEIAIDVLALGVEYGLDRLRDLCAEFLTKNLTIGTACETMQAAVTYAQDGLRRNVIGFIESHTKSVFQSQSLHELSDRALEYILQSDDLQMDELDLLNVVKEWATVNSVVSGKPLNVVALRVIIHIRLPLFLPEELRQIEEENKETELIPVEMFSYAWRYHALKSSSSPLPPNELTTPRRGTVKRDNNQGMKTL